MTNPCNLTETSGWRSEETRNRWSRLNPTRITTGGIKNLRNQVAPERRMTPKTEQLKTVYEKEVTDRKRGVKHEQEILCPSDPPNGYVEETLEEGKKEQSK